MVEFSTENEGAMPPDVAKLVGALRSPYSAAYTNLPRRAADMLESLSAQLREAREAALEEAAQLALDWPLKNGESIAHKAVSFSIAAGIRALASTGEDT